MIHVITGAPCSGKCVYVEEHKKEGDLTCNYEKLLIAIGGKENEKPDSVIDAIHDYYSRKKEKNKMLYKTFELKADEGSGKICGYFSTFDREPDSYGDVVAKGAFTDTIKAREESGHPFPLCANHDLNKIIGKVETIEETEKGMYFEASFFDTPLAQEWRTIVKSGVVYQFSFAYDVLDQKDVTLEDGTKANELRKLDLFEISIVPVPANRHAEMTDIKSGKRNSKSDEDKLRQAIDLINEVLGELKPTEEELIEVNEASEEQKSANSAKAKELLEYINTKEIQTNE